MNLEVGGRAQTKFTIVPATPALVALVDLLAGDVISSVQLEVTAAFDTAATFQLGFAGSPGILLSVGQNDLEAIDKWVCDNRHELLADATLNITFNANGATVGSARLIVQFDQD